MPLDPTMAATARREIDTGEEDIAAIAKQISDHAEAIYQTWKARGLAPTEILSCRPTPGIKLTESLRSKPKPEPKPDIKQIRHHRPEVIREPRADVRREQRLERREHRNEPEGEPMDASLPPDLVPERNGPGGAGVGARRADPAAMRLEVAREEERLLRALRTGGVVAERSAERPDVIPPISLVDYAKSRYQDRLETGARKPAAGAGGERRASVGSHVTEARSKFEARARRASSAGAVEPTATAGATGGAPVRPFLTRGSVAERVLMFEKCPSEATLELAKRKSPAATTWRGPHDVINRAQVIFSRIYEYNLAKYAIIFFMRFIDLYIILGRSEWKLNNSMSSQTTIYSVGTMFVEASDGGVRLALAVYIAVEVMRYMNTRYSIKYLG